jgi:hypothetical protein
MRQQQTSHQNGYVFLLIGLMLALLAWSSTNVAKGDNINPSVYAINSKPYGITYQDWIAKWWQWNYALPPAEHPRFNYTPGKCANGQQGPVWFLTDILTGTEQRTCDVPSGKSILVSVLSGECDRSLPNLHNDQDVRQCATEGNNYGTISASLDGIQIQNLDSYRTQSQFFNITIPSDNIFKNTNPGTYRAFVYGFFVFLHPLSSGTHDLHLKALVVNPVNPTYNYAADWDYRLIVNP